MSDLIVYRKKRELKGKELSANTIASFLVAQSVNSVPELNVEKAMSLAILRFLNRERAVGYWLQQGWLRQNGENVHLTNIGLEEIQSRESGDAVGASGRKKPGNVSAQLIYSASAFIKTGYSGVEEEVLSRVFRL